MPVLCQEYVLFSGLPSSSQPRLRLLRQENQGALTTQFQTGKLHNIVHSAEGGHMFLTCLQLLGLFCKNVLMISLLPGGGGLQQSFKNFGPSGPLLRHSVQNFNRYLNMKDVVQAA